MSWPQWQPPAQPTMPMMNTAMPMGIQYTAEQWQQMQQQNWQQWAQWQQQYQQWHQQYGAEYQKLTAMANMGAVMNTAVPPPLPTETKPPLPPDEPVQQPAAPSAPMVQPKPPATQQQFNVQTKVQTQFQSNTNAVKTAYGYNSIPENNSGVSTWIPPANNQRQGDYRQHQGKRQALDHHSDVGSSKKNKLDWQPPPPVTQAQTPAPAAPRQPFGPQLPAKEEENKEDLSDPEKKFAKQFAEWEAQFNKWKEQNQDHPDKAQYREYEKKWEAWRNQLLERRELMRQKRLGLIPASVNINTSLEMNTAPIQTPRAPTDRPDKNAMITDVVTGDSINPINSKALATLFKNNLNDGIPGLDLVDAPAQPDDVPAKDKADGTDAKPGLNLEALSKNLNSILGDQKLLSMLSLVAQSASGGAGGAGAMLMADPTATSQSQATPSGITLAPAPAQTQAKVNFDDQGSNWSTNSGNSASWSQDFSNQGLPGNMRGDTVQARDFNPVISSIRDAKGGPDQKSQEPRPNHNQNRHSRFAPMASENSNYRNDSRSGNHRNSYSSNADYAERDDSERLGDFDAIRNDARDDKFMSSNSYDDAYWSGDGQNGGADDMAPAPPTITDFDELLHIDLIMDYEHKSEKQDTTDVRVFTPRLFDYRHKLVTRIPIPERPKWLSATFHNIPEFDPPISRSIPTFARYPPVVPPGPPGNYNNFNTFSRRPGPGPGAGPGYGPGSGSQMSDMSDGGPQGDDFRRRNNKDDFERFKRQNFSGRDDRDKARDRDRYRDKERERDRSKDSPKPPFRDLKDSPAKSFDATMTTTNSFTQNQHLFSSALKIDENKSSYVSKTSIDDLLIMPGRAKRPQRIVIILRGPPGSGKTFLAKQIKDKETENGGSAPRILSLDDYFMVEQEKDVVEDGKTVKVKEMVYEYEECMEASYRQSLLKTFKKTITDGYFPFIIVDNVNDKVKYFDGMWSFAKQNGFQVYICQLDLDVQICTKRNTHGRSEVEIQHIVNGWEEVPSHYGLVDATNLIQAGSIAEVEMEEINSPNDDFDDEDNEERACSSSKWDSFECSIDNLAKLDGINKPLRSARTMEDYLQLDEWTVNRASSRPGQKRVRWADLEEHKEQEKMRAIGFVVGQTDWGRMMDPTQGGSALTQTKYIERVGIRKVNTN